MSGYTQRQIKNRTINRVSSLIKVPCNMGIGRYSCKNIELMGLTWTKLGLVDNREVFGGVREGIQNYFKHI